MFNEVESRLLLEDPERVRDSVEDDAELDATDEAPKERDDSTEVMEPLRELYKEEAELSKGANRFCRIMPSVI